MRNTVEPIGMGMKKDAAPPQRCPWFDGDCFSIEDPQHCWDDPFNQTGDRRPGYCPLIHGAFPK